MSKELLNRAKELYEYNEESGELIRLTSSGGVTEGSVAGRLASNGYIHIGIDGTRINLGRFEKYSDAVDARKNAEVFYDIKGYNK